MIGIILESHIIAVLMQTQADIVITGAKQDSRFVQALTDMGKSAGLTLISLTLRYLTINFPDESWYILAVSASLLWQPF